MIRALIPLLLIATFGVEVLGGFILITSNPMHATEILQLLATLIAPTVALAGTTVGFVLAR
jgi:hypothetical protein